MSNIPEDLKYTKTHEWIRLDDDGEVTVGITHHAQQLLGDLVFVELPEVGAEMNAEDNCAVIESVKAASDSYAPVAGEISAVNDDLADAPETINADPYGDGWIWKMSDTDPSALDSLMDAEAYAAFCEAEEQ